MAARILLYLLCLLTYRQVCAQEKIEVVENTLKVGGMSNEEFYYGFAEGDQLIFNFEELKGKELKELEIIEWPSSSRFMEYKATKISDKVITIQNTGIYKFRFYNSSLGGRICKFKLQRIAATEQTKNFNTTVYKRTIYDTVHYTEDERYLVDSDTNFVVVSDQVVKVHSIMNPNGNKTSVSIKLPPNTLNWTYFIGVDQAGKEAFAKASRSLQENSSDIAGILPGNAPLVALALQLPSFIETMTRGEDIDYFIIPESSMANYRSGLRFNYMKNGKVITDNSRMTPINESFHFCFSNDNSVAGVSVMLKVVATVVNNNWGTRPIEKIKVSSREEMYLK